MTDLGSVVITDTATGETTGIAYVTNPLTGERDYDALTGLRVQETCIEIAHMLSSIPFHTLPDKVQAAIKSEAEHQVFIHDYNPFA